MEGYWGEVTATIDWCEKNYVVSNYIAEFWNTITNLGLIFLGLFGIYFKWKHNFEIRWMLLDFFVFITGLGSAAFHGTLLFTSQLGDELPMIWSMLTYTYCVLEMKNLKKPSRSLALSIITFAILWTLASPIVHREYNTFFEVFFGMLCMFNVFNLFLMYLRTTNKFARGLFHVYIASLIIAFSFWVADWHFCQSIQLAFGQYSIWNYVGSFHGYWHIFVAINSYTGPLFASLMRSELLGWKPKVIWMFGCIPYLHPSHSEPVGQKSEKFVQ